MPVSHGESISSPADNTKSSVLFFRLCRRKDAGIVHQLLGAFSAPENKKSGSAVADQPPWSPIPSVFTVFRPESMKKPLLPW